MGRSSQVSVLVTSKPTVIGIAALPSPIYANVPFTVKGNLYDASGGLLFYVNVPGKTLHVSYDGVVVGDVVTGAAGYSLQMSIPKAGTYRVTVAFDGDAAYQSCSHITPAFTVQAPLATSLSISVSPSSGVVPFNVTVSGKLVDVNSVGVVGRTIILYVNGASVGSTTTASDGSYSFTIPLTTPGTYVFQTEFLGDVYYLGCEQGDRVQATGLEVPVWQQWLDMIREGFEELRKFFEGLIPK